MGVINNCLDKLLQEGVGSVRLANISLTIYTKVFTLPPVVTTDLLPPSNSVAANENRFEL